MIMSNDTLKAGEFHPMTDSAYMYIKENLTPEIIESMSSCAMSGNRSAEVCYGTAKRILDGDKISDRYLLGLAWLIKELNT
jgi:hypothetical protein